MVRASDLRLSGREFDPGHRTIVRLVGLLGRVGIPPGYVTSHPGELSPHTLCGTENDDRPKCGDAQRLGLVAGWLIPFVDKCVGGG